MKSSGEVNREKSALATIAGLLKRPVVIVLIVGLLIRFVLAPLFTHTYDIAHWAMIMENSQAGFGLYEMPGYYYSPVWGYIMGTLSLFSSYVLHLQPLVSFFGALLPVEDLWWDYVTPQVTTIGFNVFMKVPLILCDVIVGALVYYLIKEKTGDEKKATYGFALWFLCPIVIWMSSVQAMFDTFSVLFMLLAVLLVYKGRYFSGGAMLSIAIFTKFFPLYIIIAIVAYIMLKNREDKREAGRKILWGVAGLGIMTLILHIPMIMEGSFMDSLLFVFSRAGVAGASGGGAADILSSLGYLVVIALQPIIFIVIGYFAWSLYKSRQEDADNIFFFCLLLTTAVTFVWIPAPQYLMIIIVFLAYHIAVSDRRYFRPWLIMTVGATIFTIIMNNFSILLPLGAYTGIFDLGWVLGLMEWMQQPIFGTPGLFFLIVATGLIEAIGIWYILLIWLMDKRKGRAPM